MFVSSSVHTLSNDMHQLFGVVVDNASNNFTAVEHLAKHLPDESILGPDTIIRCACHIWSLAQKVKFNFSPFHRKNLLISICRLSCAPLTSRRSLQNERSK